DPPRAAPRAGRRGGGAPRGGALPPDHGAPPVTPEELLAADRARFAGRRVTVWGLGVFGGGVAAARHLARAGAEVLVIDTKPAAALADSVAALEGQPNVRFGLGREHTEDDLLAAELVVKSPAVPPSSPWLGRLAAAGVPW